LVRTFSRKIRLYKVNLIFCLGFFFLKKKAALAKECVNKAMDLSLTEGLNYERRLFFSTFATQDQKEGMQAFIEKREPAFQHK